MKGYCFINKWLFNLGLTRVITGHHLTVCAKHGMFCHRCHFHLAPANLPKDWLDLVEADKKNQPAESPPPTGNHAPSQKLN